MANDKLTDSKVLEDLNIRIGVEESTRNQASYDWFKDVIAQELAFQRADKDKTIEVRKSFLKDVKPLEAGATPPDRRETKVDSIDVYKDLAIVKCTVTVKSADGDRSFRNLRLWVRREDDKQKKQWKLLGWANEEV
jgi:hypothetical protein